MINSHLENPTAQVEDNDLPSLNTSLMCCPKTMHGLDHLGITYQPKHASYAILNA